MSQGRSEAECILALTASFHEKAASVNEIFYASFWGIAQGGLPSCGGSRRFCGVGGTRPPRLFPEGKRERGTKDSFLAAAGYDPLPHCSPPPIRPASIRTLGGAACSGASWGPQYYVRVLPSRDSN